MDAYTPTERVMYYAEKLKEWEPLILHDRTNARAAIDAWATVAQVEQLKRIADALESLASGKSGFVWAKKVDAI